MNVEISEDDFLRLCAQKDGEAAVREALEKHPELVECRDRRASSASAWRTPLHVASLNGREKVVRLLIEHGAKVNVQDTHKATPLHYASRAGRDEVARVLLEHGADVNARNKADTTPLHRASRNGHGKVALVLLQHGAGVNAQDNAGWTPLHLASNNDHEKVARVLLDHGADRSIENNRRETARDAVRRRGKRKFVALLGRYFPITPQMVQVLLGLRGPTESPLTRLARHSTFEPKVLSLIECMLTGARNPAFEQLQREARV